MVAVMKDAGFLTKGDLPKRLVTEDNLPAALESQYVITQHNLLSALELQDVIISPNTICLALLNHTM